MAVSERVATPGAAVPLLAVAHGSSDPAAAQAHRELLAQTGLPWHLAHLDHSEPRPAQVLDELAAADVREVVVLPLLLAHAGHARDDVGRLSSSRLRVRHGRALAPHPLLLQAAAARLGEAGVPSGAAVVVVAAGTRDEEANAAVHAVAAWLVSTGCIADAAAGFASLTGPTPAEAADGLRRRGHVDLAVLPWFLAPGRLPRAAVDAVDGRWVAPALGAHPLVARVVVERYTEALA